MSAVALALSPAERLQPPAGHRLKKFLTKVRPSSRPEDAMESSDMSAVTNARNLRVVPAHNLSNQGLARIVADALSRAFADHKSAVKAVMKVANCNERAAENWLEARNAPNAVYLLRLMAGVPELQAEIRRLTAMEHDLDPHFVRDMHQAFAVFQQMTAGR